MSTLRGIGAAAAMSLFLLAAACAQGTGSDVPGSDIPSYGDDEVALQVEYTDGFVTPELLVTRLPLLTVYGDGRVVTEGPQILVFPAPALPNVLLRQISPDDVATLVDIALAAGVGSATDFGEPPIADAPSTRFTVLTADGPQVTEVYALQETPDDSPGLTDEQVANRTALRDLRTDLTDLPGTLGADAVGAESPYPPTALAAVARPWRAGDEELADQPEIAWPGPALPGESLSATVDLSCVTVDGDAATDLLAAAEAANTLTPWTSGGDRWLVTLRPLLPHESGCADLSGD